MLSARAHTSQQPEGIGYCICIAAKSSKLWAARLLREAGRSRKRTKRRAAGEQHKRSRKDSGNEAGNYWVSGQLLQSHEERQEMRDSPRLKPKWRIRARLHPFWRRIYSSAMRDLQRCWVNNGTHQMYGPKGGERSLGHKLSLFSTWDIYSVRFSEFTAKLIKLYIINIVFL